MMFRFLVVFLLLTTSGFAQQYSHWFGIPSTWNTKIGQTSLTHTPSLAERQAVFDNPMAGSAALMADMNYAHYSFMFGHDPGNVFGVVNCYANNSDPLQTVLALDGTNNFQFFQNNASGPDGSWSSVRIPDDCIPPTGNDGLVNLINTDDPDHLWAYYKLERRTSNCPGGIPVCFRAGNVRRFARTYSQYAEDIAFGWPTGRGMGVDSIYEPFSGAQGACHASAAYPHGSVHDEDFDAGEMQHAIALAVYTERVAAHDKLYPCKVPGSTTYPVPPGNPSLVNMPVMGERLQLDPSLNIDALDIGAASKIILKGAQVYGYIPVDSVGEAIASFYVNNDGAAGRDLRIVGSSFANIGELRAYMFGNSRWIPCQPAFPNECNGANPPDGFPSETAITISTSVLPQADEDVAYNQNITAVGGALPLTWDITSGLAALQAIGMDLGTPSGQSVPFLGTPTTAGTYNFTVRVTDDNSVQATRNLSFAVAPNDPDPPEEIVNGAIGFCDPFASVYRRGTPIDIPWCFDSDLINSGTINLDYSIDGGVTFYPIATPAYDLDFDENFRSHYFWSPSLNIGSQVIVRVSRLVGSTLYGEDSLPFSFRSGLMFVLGAP